MSKYCIQVLDDDREPDPRLSPIAVEAENEVKAIEKLMDGECGPYFCWDKPSKEEPPPERCIIILDAEAGAFLVRERFETSLWNFLFRVFPIQS